MSAAEALRAARAVGVTVTLNGENIVLEADAEPPRPVLDVLARNKRAILALLESGRDGWTAADWRARFDELRAKAEVGAFNSCIAEWLNRNPSPSLAGRCAWCGKAETPSAMVVPYGAGEHHAWLHAECWRAWHESRREEATLALKKMGIALPGSLGDRKE
jgi:hypothetical protein